MYLPTWSIDLLRRKLSSQTDHEHSASAPRPILLTTSVAQQSIVKRCCLLAKKHGVREGMSVSLATAFAPNPAIAPFDPVRDFRALARLALRCLNLTPLVALDQELINAQRSNELFSVNSRTTGLILDITGTERLHHSEENLAAMLLLRFSHHHIYARISIAPTIGAAWAFSRFGKNQISIIRDIQLRHALVPLSVAALRIPADTVQTLRELGIFTIGELLKLPTHTLAVRLGVHILRRIHQALGTVEESFHALTPSTPPTVRREFEIPLHNRAAVTEMTLTLFGELLRTLALRGIRAASFLVTIISENDFRQIQSIKKEIGLNTASHNAKHMLSVLYPLVEGLQVIGEVTAISVKARHIERLVPLQHNFLSDPQITRALSAAEELLNSLTLRLGSSQIKAAHWNEAYVPEDSFSLLPIQRNHFRQTQNTAVAVHPTTLFNRPPILLEIPEQISVMALLPDNPPARIKWRGTGYKIIAGSGPERITPPWWNKAESLPLSERDYFTLQDETGRWLWVYRNLQSQKWVIHGFWT